eukprot:3231205-Amphidinium_carterae.1
MATLLYLTPTAAIRADLAPGHQRTCWATAVLEAKFQACLPGFLGSDVWASNARSQGLLYFIHMFRTRLRHYVEKLVAKQKPRKVCAIR